MRRSRASPHREALISSFLTISLLLVAIFVASSGCVKECDPDKLDAEKILNERCTKCHSLGPIEVLRVKRKSFDFWVGIISEMRMNGAEVSPCEEIALARYLSGERGG